jgi:hypothetical protein
VDRMSRIWRSAALVAVAGVLAVSGSAAAAAGGPVAQKSGAIVNYLTTGKLKIKKTMRVEFQCAVTCDAVASINLKGPGVKGSPATGSGTLPAGAIAQSTIKPSGDLQRVMRAFPARYKIVSNVTVTDPATGATDAISHVFKVKR